MPLPVKLGLVQRACTLLALLLMVLLTALLILRNEWRWYVAVPVSFIICTMLGGILKFAFASESKRKQ